MSIESERYQRNLEKARLSISSYMSDTKWIKLFKAIAASNINLSHEKIKILTQADEYPFSLHLGVDESGKYTTDGTCGPVALKEIEWVFVPAVYEIERYNRDEKLKSEFIQNDIHALKELIDGLGRFEYEFNEDGLKLYGYK